MPYGRVHQKRLLKKAIEEQLTESELRAETAGLKPTDKLVSKRLAGKTLKALNDKAIVDAREWTHILNILEDEERAVFKLSEARKKELKAVIKLLTKISKWK